MKIKQKYQHKKALVIITSVIAIIALAAIGYFIYLKSTTPTVKDTSSTTPSTAKTAQSTYSDGGAHSQAESNNSTSPAIDQKGQATNTPSSTWTTSKSGLITVKQPAANSTLKSGATLSGSSQTSSVSYTLADNVTGVLSQGTLSVVNDNFSGTLVFLAKGTTGQLNVFSLDPTTGAEINTITIPVGF